MGNRSPIKKRLNLPPEEAEALEKERQAKLRKKFVGAFVMDGEKDTIASRAKAYGLKESVFIRTVLLSGLKEPLQPKTDPEVVRALAFNLSKVGTNLNQLAKRANEAARIGSGKEVRAILTIETDLRRLMAQIAEAMARVIEL